MLDWGNKGLTDDDCKVIGYLIASGSMAKLETLGLGGNQIGDAGMSALAGAIASGSLGGLKQLWLQNNQIGDDGMAALDLDKRINAAPTWIRCFVDAIWLCHGLRDD